MSFILRPISWIGEIIFTGISGVGEVICILLNTLKQLRYIHKNPNLIVKQMISVGVSSLPLLFVTSIFTGMVATVCAEFEFHNLVADKFVGTAACKMVLIELGPLLTAIVLSGRVGSAIAAELGSMKEKEELAAYTVLGLEPYRYLALPRFVAFVTMIPCLTIISNALALIGGWIVCVLGLDITTYTYTTGMQYLFDPMDLWSGVLKSFVFGTLIFLLGYYHGVNAKAGARGVGLATMSVVVSCCLMILISDFIVDAVLFF
ncbi:MULTISPECIES: ABC transporter permease [unclassified Fibrobacter]|uniref:MlaE family ABC transporter permease n=1 Tax=unclassified Fibrobacter TaxID=2634177 RepID=UPI000D6A8242|nr:MULTISPECIES: ABC transporter permease [unclassified Fibrobacter]PWJ64407.1 phospholipid/cholesterol/gamma-HCH transport system permease protein [Fibrobacter sp. UWR4]PZW69284.1 phospholipid/cholesterol/gamma-HCH transport system permease protein [Fibrobacter sp. UWR1]